LYKDFFLYIDKSDKIAKEKFILTILFFDVKFNSPKVLLPDFVSQ